MIPERRSGFPVHTGWKQKDVAMQTSFDGRVAHGYSQNGRFKLNWNNRDNANANEGFREVSYKKPDMAFYNNN